MICKAKLQLFKSEGTNKQGQSLKCLAMKYLGVKIQKKKHSSVEDSRAAMALYSYYLKTKTKSLWFIFIFNIVNSLQN